MLGSPRTSVRRRRIHKGIRTLGTNGCSQMRPLSLASAAQLSLAGRKNFRQPKHLEGKIHEITKAPSGEFSSRRSHEIERSCPGSSRCADFGESVVALIAALRRQSDRLDQMARPVDRQINLGQRAPGPPGQQLDRVFRDLRRTKFFRHLSQASRKARASRDTLS